MFLFLLFSFFSLGKCEIVATINIDLKNPEIVFRAETSGGGSFQRATSEDGVLKASFTLPSSFTLTITLTKSYCSGEKIIYNQKISSTTTITKDDCKIDNNCIVKKIEYSVRIRNSIPSEQRAQIIVVDYNNRESSIQSGQYTDVARTGTETFNVTVYYTTWICKERKLIEKVEATNPQKEVNYDASKIDSECLIQYLVCFDLSRFPETVEFGYTIDNDTEIKTLTKPEVALPYPFSLTLYMTKSPKCGSKQYEIGTYTAKSDFKCIKITELNVNPSCFNYYHVLVDSNAFSGTLYYNNGKEYRILDKEMTITKLEPFDFDIYVRYDKCTKYTKAESIKSQTVAQTTYINNSIMPDDCIGGTIISLSKGFSDEYKVFVSVSYEEGEKLHPFTNNLLRFTHDGFFDATLYVTSSLCSEKESFKTIRSSWIFSTTIANIDFPLKCTGIQYTPQPTNIPSSDRIVSSEDISWDDNKNMNEIIMNTFELINCRLDQNLENLEVVYIRDVKEPFKFNLELKNNQFIGFYDYYKSNQKVVVYDGKQINLWFSNAINSFLRNKNTLEDADYDYIDLNGKSEVKLRLHGKGKIGIGSKETDKNADQITIKGVQIVADDVIVYVPSPVKSLYFEKVEIEKGCISALEEGTGNSKQVIIKDLEVPRSGDIDIKDLTIENSIKMIQPSKITIENINFKDGAQIEYQISNFRNMGSFITSVKECPNIKITCIEKNEPLPVKPLFFLKIDNNQNSLKDVKKKIDLSETGFTDIAGHKSQYGENTYQYYLIHPGTDTSNLPSDDDDSGPNIGLIVGIVVAVVVVIAVVVVVVIIVLKKKKNKKDKESEGEEAGKTNDEV